MECVAYMRVSTEKQAEEGNGLESQKRDIMIYAGKNNFIIKEWYIDDGYTGSNMERPALKRMINDCCSKRIKNIIAFKLDRLSRSMIDGLYMIEKIFVPNGVNFKCVHDTVNYDSPMEQAYTQMMAVFSQLDKNTMMLRMRGGMLERVKQGYWPGGGNAPYCYKYDRESGTLIQIPEKVDHARKAKDLYLQGLSDDKIKDILGFKSDLTVASILTSVVNIGKIPYKGEVYRGKHEPVFTEEEYEELQKMRQIRKERRFIQTDRANLLTGLCRCGVCGCAMRYQKWADKGYKIYCCSRNSSLKHLPNHNPNCDNTLSWANEIEKQVEEKIMEISMSMTIKDLENREGKAEIYRERLEKLKGKIKRLYMMYADGNDTVVEMISELEEEIGKVKKDLEKEESRRNGKKEKKEYISEIKKVADIWNDIDNKTKNKVLKSIIEKIVVVNGNIQINLKDF